MLFLLRVQFSDLIFCCRPAHLHAASPPVHPFLPVFGSWWNAVQKKTTLCLCQFQIGHKRGNRFFVLAACRSMLIVVLSLPSTAVCGHQCHSIHSWKWHGSVHLHLIRKKVQHWLTPSVTVYETVAVIIYWSLSHLYIKLVSHSTCVVEQNMCIWMLNLFYIFTTTITFSELTML